MTGGEPTRVNAVMRTLLADATSARVAGDFQEHGVHPLLLKGPALDALLHGSEGRRRYVDTDLLIARADFPAARARLRALGCHRVDRPIEAGKHAETWVGRGIGVIDLHQTLWGCTAPQDLVYLTAFQTRREMIVGGRVLVVPSVPFLALHAVLHALQSSPGNPRRWDEASLLLRPDRDIDWDEVVRLAERLQATTAFAAAIGRVAGPDTPAALESLPTFPVALRLLSWSALPRPVARLIKLRYRPHLTGRRLRIT